MIAALLLAAVASKPPMHDPMADLFVPMRVGVAAHNLTMGFGLGYKFGNGITLSGVASALRVDGADYSVPVQYPDYRWPRPATTPFHVPGKTYGGFDLTVTIPLGK